MKIGNWGQMPLLRLHSAVLVLMALAGCAAKPESPKDRYGLAAQPQVYLVHQTARKDFLVETKEHWAMSGALTDLASRQLGQEQSVTLQKRLDLKDPINYLKDRLAGTLQRELGLGNLQVRAGAVGVPILRESLSDETRAATAGTSATFRDEHPAGVVIELATTHWGIEDFNKVKYAASIWITDLSNSTRLTAFTCGWVFVNRPYDKGVQVRGSFDAQGRYDPSVGEAALAEVQKRISDNDGALLKADLRKAAEDCADRFAHRILTGAARSR